jgi:hypothetical protein
MHFLSPPVSWKPPSLIYWLSSSPITNPCLITISHFHFILINVILFCINNGAFELIDQYWTGLFVSRYSVESWSYCCRTSCPKVWPLDCWSTAHHESYPEVECQKKTQLHKNIFCPTPPIQDANFHTLANGRAQK